MSNMSEDDSISDKNDALVNENIVLVKLLSKYKIILYKHHSPFLNKKKTEARLNLLKELNQILHSNMNDRQLISKIHNIKSRLKQKECKNISRAKKIPFLEWEHMFLDLWADNGISTDTTDNPGIVADVLSQSSRDQTEGTIIKSETDDVLEESSRTFSESFTHNWESKTQESESQMQLNNEEYESMSLEELERAVLMSQLRMFNAQEAAARASEKLKLFKLSLLEQSIIKSEMN